MYFPASREIFLCFFLGFRTLLPNIADFFRCFHYRREMEFHGAFLFHNSANPPFLWQFSPLISDNSRRFSVTFHRTNKKGYIKLVKRA